KAVLLEEAPRRPTCPESEDLIKSLLGFIHVAQIHFLRGDLVQASGEAKAVGLRHLPDREPGTITVLCFGEAALVFETFAKCLPEKYPSAIVPSPSECLLKGLMGSLPLAGFTPDLTDAQQ